MAQYLSLRRIEGPISLTPAEIFFLRHQLSETEDQKAVLEKEIKSFDSDDLEIQLLDIQKNVKEKAITSLRNVLSPIRRIPPEILFKILQFSCLPEDGMYKADCEVTRRTFTISGVCVAWRKAAHANPLMWTKICIDFEEVKKDRLFMELMDQWMARSRGLPLDFYLDDPEAWFVRRILNFRLQMRLLYLKGQDFVSYFPFFHLPPSSLPLLEEVYFAFDWVRFQAQDLIDSIPHGVQVFLTAPKLQHVEITGDSVILLDALAQKGLAFLPEMQLTSLKIKTLDTCEVLSPLVMNMVRQSKSLARLAIYSSGFTVCRSFSLDVLRSLDCTISRPRHTGHDIVNLLRCLAVPSLEDLTLHWTGSFDSLIADVTGFQKRSGMSLSSLTLHVAPPTVAAWDDVKTELPNTVFSILGIFPTTRFFRLGIAKPKYEPEYRVDMNSLFQALRYTEGHPIAPELTQLHLGGMLPMYTDAEEGRSMILSRWWPDESERESNQRLQKVTLPTSFSQEIPDLSELPGLIIDYD